MITTESLTFFHFNYRQKGKGKDNEREITSKLPITTFHWSLFKDR